MEIPYFTRYLKNVIALHITAHLCLVLRKTRNEKLTKDSCQEYFNTLKEEDAERLS